MEKYFSVLRYTNDSSSNTSKQPVSHKHILPCFTALILANFVVNTESNCAHVKYHLATIIFPLINLEVLL